MSGTPQPDPAFLHNVPTSLPSTVSFSTLQLATTSSTISSILPSTVSSLTSSFSTATTSSFVSSVLSSSTLSSIISVITTSSASLTSTPSPHLSASVTVITTPAPTPTPTPSPIPIPASIYPYNPSVFLAIAFSALYAILVPYHFYHSIFTPLIAKSVTQKHKYTIPLLVACILSTLGFSIHIASASDPSSVGLFASSLTFVIISPIFVCATLYLAVTHLINLCLPSGSGRTFLGISPQWLGRVFIASDVLSFLCQGVGSSVAASGNWEGSQKNTGRAILIFGLAAQLVTFTVYLVVFTLFCLKVRSGRAEDKRAEIQVIGVDAGDTDHGMVDEPNSRDFGFNPLVKQVVKGIWIANVLVEVRSIYRMIEFSMGGEGYLFKHEWALWVFEATPIWLALLVLGYFHPVKWLQQKRRSAFVDKLGRQGGDRLPR